MLVWDSAYLIVLRKKKKKNKKKTKKKQTKKQTKKNKKKKNLCVLFHIRYSFRFERFIIPLRVE